nr:uncharacterized protein LOC105468942 [Macaca nemestrina]
MGPGTIRRGRIDDLKRASGFAHWLLSKEFFQFGPTQWPVHFGLASGIRSCIRTVGPRDSLCRPRALDLDAGRTQPVRAAAGKRAFLQTQGPRVYTGPGSWGGNAENCRPGAGGGGLGSRAGEFSLNHVWSSLTRLRSKHHLTIIIVIMIAQLGCVLRLQELAGASRFLIPRSEDVWAGRNTFSRSLEAFVKLLSLHNTLPLAPALPHPRAGAWGH